MSPSEISGSIVKIDWLMMIFRALKFILMILAVVYLGSISASLKKLIKKEESISDKTE